MMTAGVAFLGLVLAFLAPGIAGAARWQLVLENSEKGLLLHDAQPIEDSGKSGFGPGEQHGVTSVTYRAAWLDKTGNTLEAGALTIPFGVRTPMGPHGPGACEANLVAGQLTVVRVDGPDPGREPKFLRLEGGKAKHAAHRKGLARWEEGALLPLVRAEGGVKAGFVRSVKVRDTGPNSNRIVIAVLGDGYTAANLAAGDFERHTNVLLNAFSAGSPWNLYFRVANVYRIDIESNQQGADEERGPGEPSVTRDTYLNSTFWGNGTERLLILNSQGQARAIAAANAGIGVGQWDYLFVLVNSTKYGGSGGTIATASAHSLASDIILHEFGHIFGGLADEYSTPNPGFPAGDSEPNVDFDAAGAALKWLPWVESGTPLPTPDTPAWNSRVGAFVGARYLATGIHRPYRNCKMRQLGVPFCPVCSDALVRRVHAGTKMLDGALPLRTGEIELQPGGTPFDAQPAPFLGLVCEWRLNDSPIPGESGYSLVLEPQDAPPGNSRLDLIVKDPTPMVRLTTLEERTTWNLTNGSLSEASAWMHY